MPSLKSIKKRITSVKSTQKITKAMKMVAAAKLRKAQQAALNARHYTQTLVEVTNRLVWSQTGERHPYTLAKEKVGKREYLIFTSDRGLCGGFNSNLLRKLGDVLQKCREEKIETRCRMIGKRGRDYFSSKGWELAEAATGLYDDLDRSTVEALAQIALHRFEAQKVDEVWLVFNYFKSTLVQEVMFLKILPFDSLIQSPNYIYEPTREVVLEYLFKERVVSQMHEAFLESIASEFASRMAAMDNATNNASEMIRYLTLQYNRARQATITKELMDIVNGAEALR